ncbi:MAG TPA: hypothetical protein PLI94_03290, partial [Bacillota bacterium]|nr:hypothetical protein [Bacillota bacterium]
ERQPSKLNVAGSIPVSRSKQTTKAALSCFFAMPGMMQSSDGWRFQVVKAAVRMSTSGEF